jgi:hypothetical protein
VRGCGLDGVDRGAAFSAAAAAGHAPNARSDICRPRDLSKLLPIAGSGDRQAMLVLGERIRALVARDRIEQREQQ